MTNFEHIDFHQMDQIKFQNCWIRLWIWVTENDIIKGRGYIFTQRIDSTAYTQGSQDTLGYPS